MPRGRLFFLLLIFVSVGFLALLWSLTPPTPLLNTRYNKDVQKFGTPSIQNDFQPTSNFKSWSQLSAPILDETKRSGMIDKDPLESEKRLNELASKLSDQEIVSMTEIVKTPSQDSDLRALAVDLLARNKAKTVLGKLEEIITSKWPESAEAHVISFEQALRARAIEGLEQHPTPQATESLKRALLKNQDSFLNDHGHRALLHRQGQAKSVEEQNQEALSKILSR